MLAVDDILDDAHWVNVQDPIKQMFLSITKALRVQASSIRELDRKCSDFVTRDFVRNQVHSVEDTVCSKQDATQIIYQLQQKVDQKEHTTLQTRYEQVVQHADRLQSTVQDQALEIQSLQTHIGHLEKEIEALKNPSYDQIFAYIDRQIQHVTEDTERKLTIKADKREMETVIPQRLEDLYRTLNRKVQDLKLDVAKTATKEELIAIAQSKAERNEVRDIAADLHDKVSRGEASGLLATQTKPLFTALAAIEKAQQAQDHRLFAQVQDIADRQQSLQRLYQDHLTTYHSAEAQHQQQLQGATTEKVTAIVHEYLRERKLEDLTRVHLDGLFANHTEYLLKQMGIVGESIRLEVVATQREEMTIFKQQHEAQWRDTLAQAKELSEKHAKTRQAVKELSTNVSKALSRKVDVHEYQKLLKKWDSIETLEERLHHDVRRGRSGGGGGGGLASMTPAGHSRRNVVSSNDPNETFDILIQSLKTSSGSSSSSSSSSDGGGGNGGGGPRASPTHHHRRSAMDGADMDDEYEAAYEDGGDGAKPSIRKSFPLSASSSSPLRGARRSTTPTSTSMLRHGGSVSPSKRTATRVASSSSTSPHLDALYDELETLQQQVQLLTKKLANQSLAGTPAEVERLDWRIALGDVSMHLRRELADKVSREELLSLLRDEAALLAQKVKPLEVALEKEWSVLSKTLPATVHQVQQDLMVMQQRVAAEIQGARFLWTSGRYTALTVGGSGGSGGGSGAGVLSASCWVPWERQVINASPQVLLWRRDSPVITVKVPGLYVLTVSIFTTNLQAVARVLVYLNDEPLCQLRTTAPPTTTSSAPARVSPTASSSSASVVGLGGGQVTPMVTPITKYRHSLGDVCSYTMEEYVSLPPEARLTVCILPSSVTFAMDSAGGLGVGGSGSEDSGRAIGAQSAPQGFLALRKL